MCLCLYVRKSDRKRMMVKCFNDTTRRHNKVKVWKRFRTNTSTGELISPYMGSRFPKAGTYTSNRRTAQLYDWEISAREVNRGFHAYTNKADSREPLSPVR